MTHPRFRSPRPLTRRRPLVAVTVIAAGALTFAGCTAPEPEVASPQPAATTHVHGIVPNPDGDGFLIGTHEGIYTATEDGQLGGPVDGPVFDAMGLTSIDGTLIASGHPGPDTPPELGAPHLGIIRSTDTAQSWEPVAYTGEKDFHVLAAGPSGTLYGITTDSPDILTSTDQGKTWAPTGSALPAFNLTVDADERLIASTPDGLQVSLDGGGRFVPWDGAPLIALLNTSPDRQRIVGIGSGNTLWVAQAGSQAWEQVGVAPATPQAVAIADTGDILIAGESGLTALPVSKQLTSLN
jgi:hypothetical protein